MPKRCRTCHFAPCRCEDLAGGETLPGLALSGWPLISDAMGVHPKQVEQANARNKRHGVNVTYKKNGQAVIPDRGERRKLLKLEGFVDRSSFTGY